MLSVNSRIIKVINTNDSENFKAKSTFLDFKKYLQDKKLHNTSIINKFRVLQDFFSTMEITQIESTRVEDVEDYKRVLLKRKSTRGSPLSAHSINQKLHAIKSFFSYLRNLKRRELVRKRYKKGVSSEYLDKLRQVIDEFEFICEVENIKKEKPDLIPPYTLKELIKMLRVTLFKNDIELEHLNSKKKNFEIKIAYRDFIIILFSAVGTGARNTAVRLLLKEDLDCNKCMGAFLLKFFFFNLIEVNCKKCIPTVLLSRKNRESKYRVRIEKKVCQLVKDYIINNNNDPDCPYVFPSIRPVTKFSIIAQKKLKYPFLKTMQITRIMKRAKIRAGLPDDNRGYHSNRRTFITEIYKNGTKYELVSKQVDHQSMLGVTGVYESSNPEDWNIKFIDIRNLMPEINQINWRMLNKKINAQKLEIVKKIAIAKGGECLSKTFTRKLKFRCSEKHEWRTRYKNVRYGNWCPKCGRNKKYDLKTVKKEARKFGYRCLSNTYISCDIKMTFRCKNKHEWEAPWYSIQRGQGCPYCAGNAKLAIEKLQKLAERRGGQLISTKYINTNEKLLWKCKYGHRFKRTAGEVKYFKRWCYICQRPHNKITIEDVKKFARVHKGKLISEEYKNLTSELLWECANKHQFKGSYYNVRNRKNFCLLCAKIPTSNKLTIYDLQALANERSGECLSEAHEYKNIKSVLKWRCKNNHEWMDKVSAIKYEKRWCPICTRRYESCYRPPFTIQEIRKIAEARGGECLSTKEDYQNRSSQLIWQCAKKHKWKANLVSVLDGYWCPECEPRKGYTVEDLKKFAESKGFKFLSKEYKSRTIEYEWECKNKHKIKASLRRMLSNDTCIECKKVELLQKCREIAHKKGGQCLSHELKDIRSYVLLRCSKGDDWKTRPKAILNGEWCPKCSIEKKYTLQDAYDLAYRNGGACLSLDVGDGNLDLLWQCKNGHRWKSPLIKLINSKNWCIQCNSP
ncbi:MAG: hypothetical protein EAX96_06220 [Candidatus Lokiarchaeota archaeon]|nr:hypothetical protein [Candidatus Lokiarchaeota archaeon]